MSLKPKMKKQCGLSKKGSHQNHEKRIHVGLQDNTVPVPCSCSKNNKRVIAYYRVKWKNGTTDIQVRKLSRGFRVIEHCCEHFTRNGTGISEIIYNEQEAKALAKWYAAHLRKQK